MAKPSPRLRAIMDNEELAPASKMKRGATPRSTKVETKAKATRAGRGMKSALPSFLNPKSSKSIKPKFN